jgi:hypothetical protein
MITGWQIMDAGPGVTRRKPNDLSAAPLQGVTIGGVVVGGSI